MNLAGISKIEYVKAKGINLPQYINTNASFDITPYVNAFTELSITPNSASMEASIKETPGGDLTAINIGFRVSGLSASLKNILKSLKDFNHLYRITDNNNQSYLVGHQSIKPKFLYKETISQSPQGFKAYECQISFESAQDLVILT